MEAAPGFPSSFATTNNVFVVDSLRAHGTLRFRDKLFRIHVLDLTFIERKQK